MCLDCQIIDRDPLFNVSTYVNFESVEEFENAWKFVSNAWVTEGATNRANKAGKITTTYRCRLTYRHKPREKKRRLDEEGNEVEVATRARGSKIGIECPAKMQVVKFPNGKVEVRPAKGCTGCHSHSIDVTDENKIVPVVAEYLGNEALKGYTTSAIKNAAKTVFIDPATKQPLYATQHLERSQVNNIVKEIREGDEKLSTGSGDFEEDLAEARTWLTENQYRYQDVKITKDNVSCAGLVYLDEKMASALNDYGRWVQMDATHCTNSFNWYLFTLYARDNYGSWLPCGHFITNVQNGIIIGECLRGMRTLCKDWSKNWKPRGFLVDDSKIEKAGINNAFRGIYEGEMGIQIFNCTVHTLRTFKRRFSSDKDKPIRRKMYSALYSKTRIGCEERIREAIALTNDEQVKHYLSNYSAHSHEWSLWRRSHSPFLLQMTSTNALESYHSLVKATPRLRTLSFKSLCIILARIDDSKYVKADRARRNFRLIKLHQLSVFPGFDTLPYPLQKRLVDEVKAAKQQLLKEENDDGQYTGNLYYGDSKSCECDFCLQYLLPCRHIFFRHLKHEETDKTPLLTSKDCEDYVAMFQEGGYEVYYHKEAVEVEFIEDPIVVESRKRIDEVGNMLEEIRGAQYTVEEMFLKMPRKGGRRGQNSQASNNNVPVEESLAVNKAREEAQNFHATVERMYSEMSSYISQLNLGNSIK